MVAEEVKRIVVRAEQEHAKTLAEAKAAHKKEIMALKEQGQQELLGMIGDYKRQLEAVVEAKSKAEKQVQATALDTDFRDDCTRTQEEMEVEVRVLQACIASQEAVLSRRKAEKEHGSKRRLV